MSITPRQSSVSHARVRKKLAARAFSRMHERSSVDNTSHLSDIRERKFTEGSLMNSPITLAVR